MDIWCDTADPDELMFWDDNDLIAGHTTNAILLAQAGVTKKKLVGLGLTKPICIEDTYNVPGVIPKVIGGRDRPDYDRPVNHTCVFSTEDLWPEYREGDIVSVFAGRLMDAGHLPNTTIFAAKDRGVRVLWASTREVWNITMARATGCDIITVPPALLHKYLAWDGLPVESVRARTLRDMRSA